MASKQQKQVKRKKTIKLEDDLENEKKAIKKFKTDTEPCSSNNNVDKKYQSSWSESELLAENQNLDYHVAEVVIKLFEDSNTIPFIARYRKDVTGNLSPEQLRDIKDEYDRICGLKARAQTVLNMIEKTGKLDSFLKKAILSATTVDELEHIYAPYKPGTKRSLAERAKALGLEKAALMLLDGVGQVNLDEYVDAKQKDLSNIQEVEKGVMHIIASIIATNSELLSFLRKLRSEVAFFIESKKAVTKKSATSKTKIGVKKEGCSSKPKIEDSSKFETYFDFKISQKFIKPHQVLAINRGEALKFLSVKVVVPDHVFKKYLDFCYNNWVYKGAVNNTKRRILEMAINDSYTRLVQPLIIRTVRADLKIMADKASYDVFSSNLKQLLLMPPLKGRAILGIDPGFSNGCKLGVIGETGAVLDTAVIYPNRDKFKAAAVCLKTMLQNYNCSLIALGNGTACRETEAWLSALIQNNEFAPLEVTYTIVNESGASIYSCSAEAKKEFPDSDPNIISAISLARRVQEPLAELVKVEPKHLGVGMYQHDLPKKQLEEALDEVVMECVSFVGVDLNTASQCLLRRIAGLTDKRASHIIAHREKNGPFASRKELLNVFGIGQRIFVQCAGFLRVGPSTINQATDFYKNSDTHRLDCTYIHPESYDVALQLIKKLNLNISDIGKPHFISSVASQGGLLNITDLVTSLKSSKETINLILDAFSKPLNFDLRSECSQTPLFKKGLTNIYELKLGCLVTGSITNVTHFGCFVDIGVGNDGLIHQSKKNGFHLQIGDRVEAKVINIEIDRKRIGLQMVSKV